MAGLTDAQLQQVFKILSAIQNADETYEYWIKNIPKELIDNSIASYSSVNLSDPNQRDTFLFPLFRFNMYVIDFWLSKVVFPHEAKTFEDKLMCTSWDLCSERMNNRVTGFSGTNDTKNILPNPIAQNDLEELESTNENVRETLLRYENENYRNLPANVSARSILEKLVDDHVPVLLDSGALMLELNNKQVAEEWLKLASDNFEAAVYFDINDVLQTIDRNGTITEFDCSVYRENLNRCLVYLDDTHTRGTDLKFPLNWKACVTLSGDITRDKTVQACMRMRLLGKGHSIKFWASFEADLRIRETCKLSTDSHPSNEHVIQFICENSKKFEIENTVHWASAAHNYTKKLAAHKSYESSDDFDDLYNRCGDKEFVTLREMYCDKKEQLILDISFTKFNRLKQAYKDETIKSFIQTILFAVKQKLKKSAKDIKRFVYVLDEEQEKEIESEPEEQRQVERPPVVIPVVPYYEQNLEKIIQFGLNKDTMMMFESLFYPLERGLTRTKLFKEYENEHGWAKHICVTKDFIRVIETESQACDDFLRSVWWIARIEVEKNDYILILLSSFECNRLLPLFRKSTKSTLYMFRPRLSKQHNDLIDLPDLRVIGQNTAYEIDVKDKVQIKVYAGSMYFKNEIEQNAYCQFLGLIPRPRSNDQENAFKLGFIKPNGFVPVEYRHLPSLIHHVGQCKFKCNPVNLANALIEARHQFMRKESHAAFILERGRKLSIHSETE